MRYRGTWTEIWLSPWRYAEIHPTPEILDPCIKSGPRSVRHIVLLDGTIILPTPDTSCVWLLPPMERPADWAEHPMRKRHEYTKEIFSIQCLTDSWTHFLCKSQRCSWNSYPSLRMISQLHMNGSFLTTKRISSHYQSNEPPPQVGWVWYNW
jgi:hypothetical protein